MIQRQKITLKAFIIPYMREVKVISTYLFGTQNEEKRSTFKYVQSNLWKCLLSW
jgi:hypothetical protein